MRNEPSSYSGKGNDAVALSVIAPCFNEEGNIHLLAARTLATFDLMGVQAELILVDDGSADLTWPRIQACEQSDPRVRGVRHVRNQGMEGAWRTGLTAAKGERVCLIDADLQNRPEDIARLDDAFVQGRADVIQAVRHSIVIDRCRGLLSKGLNLLLNRLFGMRSRDNKSGFILCRREVLADILRHRFHYRYYQCFIGPAAYLRGYTIDEVETVFESRHAGQSFITRPLLTSLRTFWEMVKFRVDMWMEGRSAMARRHPVPAARLSVETSGGES
jgi:phenylacetate-CoA ligase